MRSLASRGRRLRMRAAIAHLPPAHFRNGCAGMYGASLKKALAVGSKGGSRLIADPLLRLLLGGPYSIAPCLLGDLLLARPGRLTRARRGAGHLHVEDVVSPQDCEQHRGAHVAPELGPDLFLAQVAHVAP